MPADTETRIVEMRFSNKDFERNIAKSQKSLEDFKKELNFEETSKGLRNFASSMNAIDFYSLSSNIQKLTDKFTGLGNATEWVLSRIRYGMESAMLKTEQFIKSFTTAQIAIGQSKYDALNKSVQSLIATGKYTEEEAYEVFERVTRYTDQTSANFQTMVDQISTFVSTGKGLRISESAMEGISNMTMKAGKSATEASIAMGIFSKAMGANHLSYQNWLSLNQSAHIITEDFRNQILEAAVSTGDLIKKQNKYYTNSKRFGKSMEVTAQTLETTLNKKWLSSDTMMAVFDKYYLEELDPQAYDKAMDVMSKAAEKGIFTLEDFNAVGKESADMVNGLRKRLIRAAVATGDLTEKNGKYYTNAKKYGREVEVTAENIEKTFNIGWAGKDTIGAVLTDYEFANVAYKSAQRAMTFADAMNAIKESVSTGWMESFRLVFGDVTEAMEFFTSLCERVIDGIAGIGEARNDILRVWSSGGGRQNLIDIVLGDYGKDVETGAYGLLDLFDDVGKVISKGFWDMVKIFAGTEAFTLGNWDAPGFKEAFLGRKLRDFTQSIKDFLASIRDFFTAETKVGDKSKTRLEMIHETVQGIAGALVLAWKLIEGVIYFVTEVGRQLQPSADAIQYFFGQLGLAIYNTADQANKGDSIRTFFDKLLEILTPVIGVINSVVGKLTDLLLTIIQWGQQSGVFKSVGKVIDVVFTKIRDVLNRVAGPILKFFGDLFDIGSSLFEHNFDAKSIAKAGKDIKKALDKMFSSILGVESMDNVGKELKKRIKNKLAEITEWLEAGPFKSIIDRIRSFFKDVGDSFKGDESIFKKISDFFVGGFASISDKIKNFDFKKSFGDIFEKLLKVFTDVKGKLSKTNLVTVVGAGLGIIGGSAGLLTIFKKIRAAKKQTNGAVTALSTIADNTKKTLKISTLLKIIGVIGVVGTIVALLTDTNFKEMFAKAKELTKGIDFAKTFESVFGFIKRVFERVGNWLSSVDILSVIHAAYQIFVSVELLRLLKGIADISNSIGKKLKGGDTFVSKLKSVAMSMVEVGVAIGIIAYSMKMLGEMDSTQLLYGAIAIGGIMLALGLLTRFSKRNKLPPAGTFIGLAITVAALASSIKKISDAILPFAKLTPGEWLRASGTMLVMFGSLYLVSKAFRKLNNEQTSGTKVLSALIAAIGFMATALLPYAFLKWEMLGKMAAGLGGILLELFGFSLLLKKFKIKSSQLAGLAATAAGIGILVLAILPFAFLKPAAIAKMLIGLMFVLGELFAFSLLLKKFNITAAQLTGLAATAAGIGILVLALLPFALLKPGAMVKMLLGLAGVLTELLVFAGLIKRFRIKSVQLKGVLMLSIGIMLIVNSLIPLALMPIGVMWRAIGGLAVIFVALIGLTATIGLLKVDKSQFVGATFLALSIAALALTLVPLAAIKDTDLVKAGLALLGVAAILGIMIFVVKASKMTALMGQSILSIVEILVTALALVAVVFVITEALRAIKDVPESKIATFMGGIVALTLGMAAVIVALSVVPFGIGMKAIALLAIAVAAITAILSWAIPALMGAIGSGLTDLSAKLSMMASLIQEFSDKMKATDESGISKAEGIFDRLKKLIVSLIGIGNYSAAINAFTTALFNLSTGLEIFANHTRDLPDPETGFAFKMVDKFLSYSAVLAGFAIGDFASQIYMLGVGLYAFDYLGRDMADPNDSKPLQLLTQLAACAGDIQTLSTIGLDGLKGQLAGLGGAMMLYAQGAKEVTGVEGDQTSNIQGALGILQAITTAFVENGGFTIPDMPTEDELGGFGADLAALAGALIKFSEASKGLGEGTDKAIELLGFLSDLKTKLTAENLTAVKIFKEEGITPYGLAEFSLDIFALSSALKNFVDNTKDIDEGKLKNATDALGAFSSLRGTLIGQDSVIGLLNFFTDNSITNDQLVQFGKDIEQLGLALKNFATSVTWGEEQEGSFQKALDALGFLAELKTKLPEIGGLKEIFAGRKQTLTDLGTEIEALGVAIADFNGKITDENGNEKLNLTAMSHALDIINQFVTLLTRLQTEMGPVGGVVQAFTGKNYDTTNLKTDLENFKGVIGELVGVSDLLNNNDPEAQSKIPSQEQLTSAIGAIDTITTFVKDLGEKMPKVGGQLNGIKGWFKGENYDLEALKGDLGQFKSVISELNSLAVDLNGGADGNGAVLTEATATETIGIIDRITDFMITLATKMGRIGGIENAWNDFWSGGKYDFEKLGTQIGKLGEGLGKFSAGVGKDFNAESALQAISIAEGISNVMANLNTIVDNTGYYDLDRYVEGMLNFIKVMNEGYSNPYSGFETGPMIDGIAQLASGVSKAIDEAGGIDPQNIDIFQKMVQALQQLSMTNPDFNFGTVGENIANSVAVGITGHESVVTEAAVNMALSAVEAISKLLDEELDLNPTITPVLDLTNLNNGIIRANGIINGSSMTLDTSNATSLANSSIPNTTSPIVIQNSTDLSGVYMRMEAMAIQVNELSKYIERVKVVLDTGVIAGAVTEQVDINLGTRQFYEERGN